jgi:hypothetical protein
VGNRCRGRVAGNLGQFSTARGVFLSKIAGRIAMGIRVRVLVAPLTPSGRSQGAKISGIGCCWAIRIRTPWEWVASTTCSADMAMRMRLSLARERAGLPPDGAGQRAPGPYRLPFPLPVHCGYQPYWLAAMKNRAVARITPGS